MHTSDADDMAEFAEQAAQQWTEHYNGKHKAVSDDPAREFAIQRICDLAGHDLVSCAMARLAGEDETVAQQAANRAYERLHALPVEDLAAMVVLLLWPDVQDEAKALLKTLNNACNVAPVLKAMKR